MTGNWKLILFLWLLCYLINSVRCNTHETTHMVVNATEDPVNISHPEVNVTLAPGEMEETNSEETTTRPTTVPSTEKTRKETKINKHFPFRVAEFCLCDLTGNVCDINCCCDSECSTDNREVFSKCKDKTFPTLDDGYCLHTEIFFLENVPYRKTSDSGGLMCIFTDNLDERNLYKDTKGVDTSTGFNDLWKVSQHYSWTSELQIVEIPQQKGPYVEGDLVWTRHIATNDVALMYLYQPVVSQFCSSVTPVRFLQDFTSTCFSNIAPITETCTTTQGWSARHYFYGFNVIANQHKQVVETKDTNEEPEVLLPVVPHLCNTEVDLLFRNCSLVTDIPEPHLSANVCTSVVSEVKYLFIHNGSEGINVTKVYFILTNISEQDVVVKQTFKLSYEWLDVGDVRHKSGNPGYLTGKPIALGRKTEVVNEDEESVEIIEHLVEPVDVIRVFGVRRDGKCGKGRKLVMFGNDVFTGCTIELQVQNTSNICTDIQDTVLHLLLGSRRDILENMYVPSFGNSMLNDTKDWVKAIVENLPILQHQQNPSGKCPDIIQGLDISVAFAKVGALVNPQKKIVAIKYRFTNQKHVDYVCTRNCYFVKYNMTVTTTVTFIDVSKPAVLEFPEPPILEIKLPYDFFYPFQSAATKPTTDWLSLSCFLVFLYYIKL